jgi:hypothetical protein
MKFVFSANLLLSSLAGVTGCPFASTVNDGKKLPNGHPQLQNRRHFL